MKYYYFALILLSMISCKSSNKQEEKDEELVVSKFEIDSVKIGNKIFSIDSISQTDFEKYNPTVFDKDEGNNLHKDSSYVNRVGDSLIFKISNGRTATFVNTKGENYGSYRYLGKLINIGQYLVQGSFDEWSSNYLINEMTGDTTEICGVPIISPDNKFLISGNADLIAGFTFNGFDLFKIENKSLKKIGRRELSEWGPSNIKWVSENEILSEIRITEKDHTKGRLERTGYIKLRIE